MPIKRFEEATCDVCGAVANREFFLGGKIQAAGPGDGWQLMAVKDPKDLRRKKDVAVCGACIDVIQDRLLEGGKVLAVPASDTVAASRQSAADSAALPATATPPANHPELLPDKTVETKKAGAGA